MINAHLMNLMILWKLQENEEVFDKKNNICQYKVIILYFDRLEDSDIINIINLESLEE